MNSDAYESVRSLDGTRIAYRRIGSGPPIVAVHGGLGTAQSWQPVAELLADRFEVFLIERRGRGASEPGGDVHELAHEVADVHAVVLAAGGRAALLGHSYGGALALEVARAAPETASAVIVYEPPAGVGARIPASAIDRIDHLARSGRPHHALELGIRQLDAAGLVDAGPAPEHPCGPPPRREALAPLAGTVARELRAVARLGPGLDRYAAIDVPTLVLAGARSPQPMRDSMSLLGATLPRGELAWLPEHGHVAHSAAPEEIAGLIAAFLDRAQRLG